MSSTQDQQNIAIVAALSEIKGTLNSFVTQFQRHEATDLETARQIDQRLERTQRLNDQRGMDFIKVIEQRFSEIGDRIGNQVEKLDKRVSDQIKELDTRLDAITTKVEGVTEKQSFSAGGWRFLSIAAGVAISLITSVASLVIQVIERGH